MIKTIFNWLTKNNYLTKLAACFVLHRSTKSYLNDSGWFKSIHMKMPIDNNGNAIPWYTYSSIEFLEPRINKNMNIFEYGSGNSTIWWSKQVKKIISCENDLVWFEKIKPLIQKNVEYIHVDLSASDNYERAAQTHGGNFDIIIIDGRNRINCARNSISSLKDDGVIIWDNSDRQIYQDGYQYLMENGFRRLDFTGMGPINTYSWCTSVFYRTNNCLDI